MTYIGFLTFRCGSIRSNIIARKAFGENSTGFMRHVSITLPPQDEFVYGRWVQFVMSRKLSANFAVKNISEQLYIIYQCHVTQSFKHPSMKDAELCDYFISSDVLEDILMLYSKLGKGYYNMTVYEM